MALDLSKPLLDSSSLNSDVSPADLSTDALGPSSEELLNSIQAPENNFKDINQMNYNYDNSRINSRVPTPTGKIPVDVSVEDIGLVEPRQLILQGAAQKLGRPLSRAEEHQLETGTPISIMGTEAQGNTLPKMVQSSEVPVETPQTTGAVDVSKIYNPFGGSQGLANAGIDAAEKAALQLSAAKAKMADEKLLRETEYIKKVEDLQAGFDVQYQEKMDDLNSNIQEYRQLAGSKVIPGAFLARQDTQASIMTGLAIALGAAGQGLMGPGSSNLGIEMINKAIDRDVEAQRFNLDTKVKLKKLEADTNENLLSQMRVKFGDDRSAYLATKVSMLAMAEEKFNQQINQKGGAQDQMAKANALAAKSQLAQQRESYEMQLRASQQQQYNLQEMLGGADKKKLTGEQAIALYGKNADKYVYGYGLAPSLAVAKIMNEKVVPIKGTLDKMDDVIKYAKNYSNLSLKERDLMTAKLRDLQLYLKNEDNYGLGVLNPVDLKVLQDVTGNPNNLNPFVDQLEKIQMLRESSKKRFDSKVRSLGFEPEETPESKINFK